MPSLADMIAGPNGILSLDGLVNPFVSSDPPEPTTFAQTLLLDSTSFLRGLLRANQTIRYAIDTSGPLTVISHPATSRNAAVIRWASGTSGKRTTIETGGVVMTLDAWVKVTDWGSTKRFQRYGQQPWIKWTEKRGRWQAIDLDRRVLAVLISRKSALGTRLKLTSTGLLYADALVLTALVTVTGPHDWRRFPAQEPAPSIGGLTVGTTAASHSEHALPTYRQASFTRPLASLTNTNASRGLAPPGPLRTAVIVPNPAIVPGQPVILSLDSRQLLSGVFSHDGRPEMVITTVGPYTTLARYVPAEDWSGEMTEDGRRLQRVATIEWVSSSFKGKRMTRIRMRGQKKILDEVMFGGGMFFESRERRFGSPGFLPWLTWSTSSSRATSSLSLSTTASASSAVRYTCLSHPAGRPLATLSRKLTSAGTLLELTPEGWDILDSVLVTCLLVVCGGWEWKRVAGIGVPAYINNAHSPRGRRGSIDGESEDGMAVGEEMITGLDGWTSPPELVELSPGREGGGGGGIGTPRGVGAMTPFALSARGTPVPSRAPSPPPYA